MADYYATIPGLPAALQFRDADAFNVHSILNRWKSEGKVLSLRDDEHGVVVIADFGQIPLVYATEEKPTSNIIVVDREYWID